MPAVAEPVGTAAPAESGSGSTLDAEVGALFGDYVETPASPESSDTGTTPATPPADAAPSGETAPALDSDTAAASDGTTPDAPTDADDPWKDTTPAQYFVGGQPVLSEDIRVFKEGGAAIRPEALPNILSQLAERATLSTRVKQQEQDSKSLAPLTEWTPLDAEGKPTGEPLTGLKGLEAFHVDHAVAQAELSVFRDLLSDPAKLVGLLIKDGDQVVFDPSAVRQWNAELKAATTEARYATRDKIGARISEASRPEAQPVDYAAEAPNIIRAAAGADLDKLTPDDVKLLSGQLRFYHRQGTSKIDGAFGELVQDRIAQRKQLATVTQTVSDATRDGQARMLAAARGVKPATKPATTTPRPNPVAERVENESNLYEQMERAGAAAMRASR